MTTRHFLRNESIQRPAPTQPIANAAGGHPGGLGAAAATAVQNFVMATRSGDRDRVDISTELIVFAGSSCTGAFNRWPTGDIGSMAARRTEGSAATTATWGRWRTTMGEVWSSVWHWLGSVLCLLSGVLGQDSDPEIRLPTADSRGRGGLLRPCF